MANASLKAERKRRSKFSRQEPVAHVANSSVIPWARETSQAFGTRDCKGSPCLREKKIGRTKMKSSCVNASSLRLRSTRMYLTHHSSLKTESINAVVRGRGVLTSSFEYETLCIFVAGAKFRDASGEFCTQKP
jgi:hypothetical protein